MTPSDSDRDETPFPADRQDDRFWDAFAEAAGFADELRQLAAAGEIDAADFEAEGATCPGEPAPEDLLAAARLHDLLIEARPTPAAGFPLAPVPHQPPPRRVRFRSWVAAGALAALGTAAAVLVAVRMGEEANPDDDATPDIASAERLAESWIAVRETAFEPDALDAEAIEPPPGVPVDAAAFEDAPDWLALAVAREAELAAGAVEEATP